MDNTSFVELINGFCYNVDQYHYCYKSLMNPLPNSALEWIGESHNRLVQGIRTEIEKRWRLSIDGGGLLAKELEDRDLSSAPVLRTIENLEGDGCLELLGDPFVVLLPTWPRDKIELKRLVVQTEVRALDWPEQKQVAADSPAAADTEQVPMRSLGMRNYAVGSQSQVVEASEDAVLQVFFAEVRDRPLWIAKDAKNLRSQSSYSNAPRLLKGMKAKYACLSPAIICPGKRGRGGLQVLVMRAESPREK